MTKDLALLVGPDQPWLSTPASSTRFAEGRMTEHGLRHVDAAKADGRWDRTYRVRDAQIPADLQAAIDADPKAKAMFATLTAQNRFALVFRIMGLKTEAGRRKRIEAFVAMLARGETIHPQRSRLQP
jgi:uncharacterized protein YdeI (YjbR/CyaY-like superfamily)